MNSDVLRRLLRVKRPKYIFSTSNSPNQQTTFIVLKKKEKIYVGIHGLPAGWIDQCNLSPPSSLAHCSTFTRANKLQKSDKSKVLNDQVSWFKSDSPTLSQPLYKRAIFIGLKSNHCLKNIARESLPCLVSHWWCWDLTDITLACEDAEFTHPLLANVELNFWICPSCYM